MKLHAHVGFDGRLLGLVAAPEGKVSAGLIADAAVQVCEIRNHGLKSDAVDLEALEHLLESHSVRVTPAQAELIGGKPAA